MRILSFLTEPSVVRKANFARMVRFRNRAVHLYEEIAPGEVARILREDLGDFDAFVRAMVERYLA